MAQKTIAKLIVAPTECPSCGSQKWETTYLSGGSIIFVCACGNEVSSTLLLHGQQGEQIPAVPPPSGSSWIHAAAMELAEEANEPQSRVYQSAEQYQQRTLDRIEAIIAKHASRGN